MKIVIAGAGEVGSHLAKLLSSEEQDIMLLDSDQARLAMMDANYNIMTVRGNPISFKSLRMAGGENSSNQWRTHERRRAVMISCAASSSGYIRAFTPRRMKYSRFSGVMNS